MEKQDINYDKFSVFVRNNNNAVSESIKNTFKYVEHEKVRFYELHEGYYTILVDEINTNIPGFLTMMYNNRRI